MRRRESIAGIEAVVSLGSPLAYGQSPLRRYPALPHKPAMAETIREDLALALPAQATTRPHGAVGM